MTKSMTKTFLAAGTLALAVAGSSRAFGHGMGGGDGCGHGGLLGGGRVLHALDLSPDQKQGVHDIFREHRPTLAQLGANERAAWQAIADKLLGTGTVAQNDLDALVQQESQARTALMRERRKYSSLAAGSLTNNREALRGAEDCAAALPAGG